MCVSPTTSLDDNDNDNMMRTNSIRWLPSCYTILYIIILIVLLSWESKFLLNDDIPSIPWGYDRDTSFKDSLAGLAEDAASQQKLKMFEWMNQRLCSVCHLPFRICGMCVMSGSVQLGGCQSSNIINTHLRSWRLSSLALFPGRKRSTQ